MSYDDVLELRPDFISAGMDEDGVREDGPGPESVPVLSVRWVLPDERKKRGEKMTRWRRAALMPSGLAGDPHAEHGDESH